MKKALQLTAGLFLIYNKCNNTKRTVAIGVAAVPSDVDIQLSTLDSPHLKPVGKAKNEQSSYLELYRDSKAVSTMC